MVHAIGAAPFGVLVRAVVETRISRAANVHPAPIGYPLNTRIVAVPVAAVVRPTGGECDASAYAPPRPPASTAPASPSAAGPSACPSISSAGPGASADPDSSTRPCESHSSGTCKAHAGATEISGTKTWASETAAHAHTAATHVDASAAATPARFSGGGKKRTLR